MDSSCTLAYTHKSGAGWDKEEARVGFLNRVHYFFYIHLLSSRIAFLQTQFFFQHSLISRSSIFHFTFPASTDRPPTRHPAVHTADMFNANALSRVPLQKNANFKREGLKNYAGILQKCELRTSCNSLPSNLTMPQTTSPQRSMAHSP